MSSLPLSLPSALSSFLTSPYHYHHHHPHFVIIIINNVPSSSLSTPSLSSSSSSLWSLWYSSSSWLCFPYWSMSYHMNVTEREEERRRAEEMGGKGKEGVEIEEEAGKREYGGRGWKSTPLLHDEDPSWCLKPNSVLSHWLCHFLNVISIKASHLLFLYVTIEMTVVLRNFHDAKDRKFSAQCLEVNACCCAFNDGSGVWLFSSEWGDTWSHFLWDFWQFLLV